MPKCWLHVGMKKTGTTSIQRSLAALPADRGPQVIKFKNANMSGVVMRGFAETLPETYRKKDADDREKTQRRLARVFRANKDNDIIFSAELFDRLTPKEFATFCEMIPHNEVEIIIYIRPPHAAMQSAMQQRIKAGAFGAPSSFNAKAICPDYALQLDKYEGSKLPLQVAVSDRKRLHNGCVVQDFCSRTGVQISPEEVLTTNESISMEGVMLMHCYNLWRDETKTRWVPVEGGKKSLAMVTPDVLKDVGNTKFKLSRDLTEQEITRRSEEFDRIEALLGHSFVDLPEKSEGLQSMDQLLAPPEEATQWLADKVGAKWEANPSSMTIGEWMHTLFQKTDPALKVA